MPLFGSKNIFIAWAGC
ncbi:unnamed protein product, partial [Vitis vinifera]